MNIQSGGLLVAKRDRIPDAWPILMSDDIAARYLDMSKSMFLSLVRSKHLPGGKKFAGSSLVRWHRSALDDAVATLFGLLQPGDRRQSDSDGTDWMEAINAR